jgi:ferredoxin
MEMLFRSGAFRSVARSTGVRHAVWTPSSTAIQALFHQSYRNHGSDASSEKHQESITIQWKQRDGSVVTTPATLGSSLLNVAHKHDIDLEGACAGVCACSTCHVILDQSVYDDLPEPSEDEEDMLDQAFGLTGTSRLGCQICLEKKHDGMLVTLPKATRNFYVDGHKPKPH